MYQRISIHLYGYQECIELDGGAGNCHPFKVTKSIVCINSAAQLVNQQMSLFREDSNGSSKGKLKKNSTTYFVKISCQTFYGICLTLPLFGGLGIRKLSSQRFPQILSDLVQTARFMLLLPESHLHGRRRGDVIIIVRLPNHCQRPHRSCVVIYISSTVVTGALKSEVDSNVFVAFGGGFRGFNGHFLLRILSKIWVF